MNGGPLFIEHIWRAMYLIYCNWMDGDFHTEHILLGIGSIFLYDRSPYSLDTVNCLYAYEVLLP